MKEVACAVCGAVYRFAPADIPPAGKSVTCAKCKARIQIPGAAPEMSGGAGDVIDLADLPAPKRPGPPPLMSSDPLTLDSIDLVAPVGPTSRSPQSVPPSGPPLVGEPIDLPMPSIGISDLPAPKRAAGPAPVELPDLPAPKRAPAPPLPDLPAPKRAATPAPPKPPSPPAPTAPAALFDDLPAPKSSIGDLPAPKRPSAMGDLPNLPAPKGPSTSTTDVAPKGFFADLPQPKGPSTSTTDVAPKGFYADLPQPKGLGTAATQELTPKGPPGTDLTPKGPPGTDLTPKGPPATDLTPKGPPGTDLTPKRATYTDVTPKGPPTQDLAAKGPPSQDMAPKGFFDDLPGPRIGANATPLDLGPSIQRAPSMDLPSLAAGRNQPLDLDGLDGLELSNVSGLLELEPPAASAKQAAGGPAPAAPPVRPAPGTNPPPLELGGDADSLAGLDLASPTAGVPLSGQPATGRGGVVSFKTPSSGQHEAVARSSASPGSPAGDLDLALPSRRDQAAAKPVVRTTGETKAAGGAAVDAPRVSKKTLRIALIAGLVVALAGAGGFYAYTKWQAKQQHAADVRSAVAKARASLAGGGKNRWDGAARAARAAIALDKQNAEALGIAAQALIAGYLDEGTRREPRLDEAQRHLAAVPAGAGRNPAVDKAIALDLIVDGDTDAAAARLQPLAAKSDADALLYLGWAHLAAGRWDDAIAAFDGAIKAAPPRAAPSRYGLARAQLGKGDRAAARATFLEIIGADPEHVGALVGEAEAMPAAEFVRREAALLAILQRKGIETADPRVVARAWTLAGDDARRSGRLDAARDRYRKALTLWPNSVDAMVASAALELRDGKLDAAAVLAEKALALAPADVAANLAAAELDVRRNRLADAAARLGTLRTRTPPLTGSELGRFHLLDGMRLDAEGEHDAALAAFDAAGQALGPDEVEPAIASATLLGRMAKAAREAKDEARARTLEAQAKERLDALAAAAEQDPALAVTLGVAYLDAGSAAESEAWLRKAIAKRPDDIEANFQLAEALRRQGKQDEALATLVKTFELDETRVDLGVELARGFEDAGKDADAAKMYARLVAGTGVSLDIRARAGRFFARTGDFAAASKQGDAILDVEKDNPTGMFLRAEGLLADGHADRARALYQQAADADPDPQFLDGLGRASEALAERTGDTARRDEALRAYLQATEKAPKMLNPLLGRGRLHMARREFAKALAAFEEAMKVAPGEPSIAYGMGMSYAELGDKARAIEWLTRSVKLQPRAEAYFKLGDIYYQLDKASAAAQALGRATELGLAEERRTGKTVPWLTDAYWLLGDVERVRGSDSGQRRAWERYLERGPTDKAQADEVRRALMGLR